MHTVTLKGIEGAEKISSIMKRVRSNPPKKIGEYNVSLFCDYDEDKRIDYTSGETDTTGLSRSNVLYFEKKNDTWCCIRPSGTEPKLKLYMGVKGSTQEEADKEIESFKSAVLKLLEQ